MSFHQIQQCVFDLRAERGSRICDFRRHIVHASAVRTRIRLLLPDCSTVQPGDRSGTVSAIQPAVDNHIATNSSIRFHIFFGGFTRRHSRIFEYRKLLMVDVHMQSVNPVIGRFIVKVDSDIRCVKSNTHAITQHQWVPIHVSTNERVNQSVDAGNLQQLVTESSGMESAIKPMMILRTLSSPAW